MGRLVVQKPFGGKSGFVCFQLRGSLGLTLILTFQVHSRLQGEKITKTVTAKATFSEARTVGGNHRAPLFMEGTIMTPVKTLMPK